MQKPDDHNDNLRRSKSYIEEQFFAPIHLKTGNLIEMFEQNQAWRADQESQEFLDWQSAMLEMIPKL